MGTASEMTAMITNHHVIGQPKPCTSMNDMRHRHRISIEEGVVEYLGTVYVDEVLAVRWTRNRYVCGNMFYPTVLLSAIPNQFNSTSSQRGECCRLTN